MIVPINVNLGKAPKLPNGMHHVTGGVIYIRDGFKHRENGPAEIKRDGYKAWYFLGMKHRRNGPAVVHADGTKEYWENGKFIRKEKD